MRIKTITCHDVYNHGASLQAYALQYYLRAMGHDAEIIDYKPDYLSQHYKYGVVGNPKYDKPFVKSLYVLAKTPGYLSSLKRRNLFDLFRNKYLLLTTRRYHSISELRANPPDADLYIAGSDQIWNTSFPNGKDAAFYLDFMGKDVRKASYAASFATDSVPSQWQPQLREWINRLDFISIREHESLGILRQLGIKRGCSVLDPVFLLPRAHWENIASEGRMALRQPYTMVYAFDNSPACFDIVKNIRKKNPHMTIYELSPRKLGLGINIHRHVGPLQFLYLLMHAEIIISNSFHASAFSLIMEKNFCVTSRLDGLNNRMKNLMNLFGLSKRYVTRFSPDLLSAPDFTTPRARMQEELHLSIKYLNEITRG